MRKLFMVKMLIVLVVSGCSPSDWGYVDPKNPPKFYNGNVVIHKGTLRRGVITGFNPCYREYRVEPDPLTGRDWSWRVREETIELAGEQNAQ